MDGETIKSDLARCEVADCYGCSLATVGECRTVLCNEANKLITELEADRNRLLYLCRKMHTWIFLNVANEERVYNELGFTDEENVRCGYSGQIEVKENDANDSD